MFGISAGIIGSASGFNPLDLDPVLLLDAGQGVTESGGLVSSWANQGTGTTDATQATGSAQPTYNATGFGSNSLPYLDFDGTADFLTLGTEYSKLPNYTVFSVIVSDNTARFGFVFGDGNTLTESKTAGVNQYHNSSRRYANQFGDGTNFSATESGITLSNSTAYILNSTYTSGQTKTEQQINGVNQTESTPATAASSISGTKFNMSVGRFGESAFGYFDGKIAEIIIYDYVLTSTEIDKVTTYLNNKYAVY